MPKNPRDPYSTFAFAFFVAAVWSLIIFLAAGWMNGLSLAALGDHLLAGLYLPHYNNCTLRSFEDIPMAVYIYGIMLASFLSLFAMRAMVSKTRSSRLVITALKHGVYATLGIFLILQILNQAGYTRFIYKTYAAKPVSERCPEWLAPIRTCGTFFHEVLPEKRSAEFISDLDASQTLGMIVCAGIAYYLYPVDTRDIRQEPIDTIVVIEKENPLESIPKNYKIIGNINDRYFLAVKKDGL